MSKVNVHSEALKSAIFAIREVLQTEDDCHECCDKIEKIVVSTIEDIR